jgi:predicted metal-dependent phosphoesterase TrpH
MIEARRVGIDVLAITDHDTFAGYDAALPFARELGINLLCGIELSTKLNGRSVHLLGYFISHQELAEIREWTLQMQETRRERNRRLITRLRGLGLDITLEEVQARGRGLIARPHFAQVMVEKGYVTTIQDAFDQYLDESAISYVPRQEPTFAEGVAMIRNAGGIASLAHPIRVLGDLSCLVPQMCSDGLNALEVYHSDHNPVHTATYLALAKQHNLLITGGSDFHGAVKPGVSLGTGRDRNLSIPADLFVNLKSRESCGLSSIT